MNLFGVLGLSILGVIEGGFFILGFSLDFFITKMLKLKLKEVNMLLRMGK